MTVIEKPSRKVIAAIGQSTLSFDIYIESASHIEVWADDELLDLGVDFTVSGVQDADGFTVTLLEPGDWDNDDWIIKHVPPITQEAQLSLGGLFGTAHESALDAITRRIQSIKDDADRAFKLKLASQVGAHGGTIDVLAAGEFPMFDGLGNMVRGGSAADIAAAQPSAEAAVEAAAAAEAAALLAQSYADQINLPVIGGGDKGRVLGLDVNGLYKAMPISTLNIDTFDAGLIGDGVVDDAAKLQSVLNFAASIGVAVIASPGKVFAISSQITLPANLAVASKISIVIKAGFPDQNAFIVNSGLNCGESGQFVVDASNMPTTLQLWGATPGLQPGAVFYGNAAYEVWLSYDVTNPSGGASYFDNSPFVTIYRPKVTNPHDDVWHITGGFDPSNPTHYANQPSTIDFYDCPSPRILFGKIYGRRFKGYSAHRCTNPLFLDCNDYSGRVPSVGQASHYIYSGATGYGGNIFGGTVIGGANNSHGPKLSWAIGATVQGMYLFGCGNGALMDDCTGCTIKNNLIRDVTGYGAGCYNAAYAGGGNFILDNYILGAGGQGGIAVYTHRGFVMRDITVAGNVIHLTSGLYGIRGVNSERDGEIYGLKVFRNFIRLSVANGYGMLLYADDMDIASNVVERPTMQLDYDAKTVEFTASTPGANVTVTGGTSGATARIIRVVRKPGNTGTLWLEATSGTFVDNETITDGSGGSATANGASRAAVNYTGIAFTGPEFRFARRVRVVDNEFFGGGGSGDAIQGGRIVGLSSMFREVIMRNNRCDELWGQIINFSVATAGDFVHFLRVMENSADNSAAVGMTIRLNTTVKTQELQMSGNSLPTGNNGRNACYIYDANEVLWWNWGRNNFSVPNNVSAQPVAAGALGQVAINHLGNSGDSGGWYWNGSSWPAMAGKIV